MTDKKNGHEKPQLKPLAVIGTCCKCGYDGNGEVECTRDDETHCEHWWEGQDDDG